MANKKKGFIARMIEGPERSDTYAQSTLPGNRWELGWDVFRNNLGKIIGLNLLMLVFLLPLFAIIFYRYMLVQYYAITMPFSQNIGLGYPAIPLSSGLPEQINMMANNSSLIFLPLAAIIASVGLSGGMYVMRNMIWAEGVSVVRDFWAGVKKNFGVVLFATLIYSVLVLMCVFSISYGNFITAVGEGAWWLTASIVVSYILLALLTLVYLYMLTIGVTYKLKLRHLLKNSFIMSIALLPTNIFFAVFALISVVLLMAGGLAMTIGLMLFVLFGVSGAALVWTDYSQWTFDKFINDKVPGAVKNKGIYSKTGDDEEKDFSFERSTLGKRPIKPITDYDVEIAELPTNFSRADLRKLEESKAAMRKDSDDYVVEMLASNNGSAEKTETEAEESLQDGELEAGGDEE